MKKCKHIVGAIGGLDKFPISPKNIRLFCALCGKSQKPTKEGLQLIQISSSQAFYLACESLRKLKTELGM